MRHTRGIISAALVVLLVLPAAASGVEPAEATPEIRAVGILVKPRPGRTAASLSAVSAAPTRVGRSGVYRVSAGTNIERTLAELRADPAVEWAEPNYIRELSTDYTSMPNDPHFRDGTTLFSSVAYLDHTRSWYLRGNGSIGADLVWPYLAPAPAEPLGAEAPASAFPVAVIDSGFYMSHPDRGPTITAGKDCFGTYTYATGVITIDDDVTPAPPTAPNNNVYQASHGTCVAGEIAAAVNNGIGTVGAGYDAHVRVYKVLGVCVDEIPELDLTAGSAIILDSAVIDAIHRATDDGCKVICMSLGGPDASAALQEAVDYAHARGVLVVAATGNSGASPVQYPAACANVLGVGSYRIDDNRKSSPVIRRSGFTSYGPGLDLLAPGEDIWGLVDPYFDQDGAGSTAYPGYMMWNGTSMATPLVAGAAAALWRFAPELNNDELAKVLFRSARDLGPAGYDTGYGWGAFNMDAARVALCLTVTPVQGTAEVGTDRIGTAIAASRLAFASGGASYVLLATAYNWPDALGGSALAGVLDAPILLTRQDTLPAAVAAEITRLGATHVIVLGGTGAVSDAVLRQLRGVSGVTTVERLAGATRYETADAIAERTLRELGAGWDGRALVVTGEAFPDALGGSPLSTAMGWPVYLVDPRPAKWPAMVGGMRVDGVDFALILGGTSAVPARVESDIAEVLGPANVDRLTGATRYETAVEIARYGVDNVGLAWNGLAVASGEDFPDALAGGVLQGHSGSVVLFSRADSLPDTTREQLLSNRGIIDSIRFLGGTGALSSAVRQDVTTALTR